MTASIVSRPLRMTAEIDDPNSEISALKAAHERQPDR
jgi:hypothetical protein